MTDKRNIGPKMAFIFRVYQMTEAEHDAEVEHDRMMLRSSTMSEREFLKRASTRSVARRLRHRDDASAWPRDMNTKPYRYRRLRDGKVGRWGELAKDSREGDDFVRLDDEAPRNAADAELENQTKH